MFPIQFPPRSSIASAVSSFSASTSCSSPSPPSPPSPPFLSASPPSSPSIIISHPLSLTLPPPPISPSIVPHIGTLPLPSSLFPFSPTLSMSLSPTNPNIIHHTSQYYGYGGSYINGNGGGGGAMGILMEGRGRSGAGGKWREVEEEKYNNDNHHRNNNNYKENKKNHSISDGNQNTLFPHRSDITNTPGATTRNENDDDENDDDNDDDNSSTSSQSTTSSVSQSENPINDTKYDGNSPQSADNVPDDSFPPPCPFLIIGGVHLLSSHIELLREIENKIREGIRGFLLDAGELHEKSGGEGEGLEMGKGRRGRDSEMKNGEEKQKQITPRFGINVYNNNRKGKNTYPNNNIRSIETRTPNDNSLSPPSNGTGIGFNLIHNTNPNIVSSPSLKKNYSGYYDNGPSEHSMQMTLDNNHNIPQHFSRINDLFSTSTSHVKQLTSQLYHSIFPFDPISSSTDSDDSENDIESEISPIPSPNYPRGDDHENEKFSVVNYKGGEEYRYDLVPPSIVVEMKRNRENMVPSIERMREMIEGLNGGKGKGKGRGMALTRENNESSLPLSPLSSSSTSYRERDDIRSNRTTPSPSPSPSPMPPTPSPILSSLSSTSSSSPSSSRYHYAYPSRYPAIERENSETIDCGSMRDDNNHQDDRMSPIPLSTLLSLRDYFLHNISFPYPTKGEISALSRRYNVDNSTILRWMERIRGGEWKKSLRRMIGKWILERENGSEESIGGSPKLSLRKGKRERKEERREAEEQNQNQNINMNKRRISSSLTSSSLYRRNSNSHFQSVQEEGRGGNERGEVVPGNNHWDYKMAM